MISLNFLLQPWRCYWRCHRGSGKMYLSATPWRSFSGNKDYLQPFSSAKEVADHCFTESQRNFNL